MTPERRLSLRQTIGEHYVAVLLTLALVALSFVLHLNWCKCTMQYPVGNFDKMLDLHLNGHPYSLRLMTSYSILLLNDLGFNTKQSFFILQYALVILLAFTFYRYLLTMGFARSRANLGLFLFLTSYPILAAHMAPVHTYDDFWAHLFTILSFTAAVGARPIQGMLWFTLACFAREQSFILLPALVLTARLFNPNRSLLYLIALAAVPVFIYGTYFTVNSPPPRPDRLLLILKNFETTLRASDTVYSLIVSFGFAWLTTLIGLVHVGRSSLAKSLYWGTILTLPATVVFTLFFTNARETRILFPPFLFVIPMATMVTNEIYSRLRATFKLSGAVIVLLVFGSLMVVGIVLGNIAFPAFDYRQCPKFHRLWAGLQFGLLMNLAVYTLWRGFKGFVLGGPTSRGG